jgi:hypothetical protein
VLNATFNNISVNCGSQRKLEKTTDLLQVVGKLYQEKTTDLLQVVSKLYQEKTTELLQVVGKLYHIMLY